MSRKKRRDTTFQYSLLYWNGRKRWRKRKIGSVRQHWVYPVKGKAWDHFRAYCTVLRKTWKFK